MVAGPEPLEPSAGDGARGSARAAFVLRLARDEAGRLTGIVERVRTGEKQRFEDLGAIAPLIARMLRGEETEGQEEDRS
jgi:hypothetical protein